MQIFHLILLLISAAAATSVGFPEHAKPSGRAMDVLCGNANTAALAGDFCKDWKPPVTVTVHPAPVKKPVKKPPPPPPRKVYPPPPPPCKKVSEKCYKDYDCCTGLKCRSDARDKRDQVCYKPCVPLGEYCSKKEDCCDYKANCVDKVVKDCYDDKYGKHICKDIKVHVCELPPCVPEHGDCYGGKHCCKGLQCQELQKCPPVACSQYDKKKGKCPMPKCETAYLCEKH